MFPLDVSIWRKTLYKTFCYFAVEKETDRAVSCCITCLDEESENGEELYTGGCYFCAPEYRGTGVSKEILRRICEIGSQWNGGGNGYLPDGRHMIYAKVGFNKFQPFVNVKAKIKTEDIVLPTKENSLSIKDYHNIDWNRIANYDRTVSSRKRGKFMKLRLTPNEYTHTKVIVDKNEETKGLVSFRFAMDGNIVMGPFYADNEIQTKMKQTKDVIQN